MKKVKCKFCKISFEKKNALNPYCSPKCETKAKREREKLKKQKEILKKQKKREKKKNSLSFLIKQADILFSQYVRLRDSKDGENVQCVTCPVFLPIKEMQNGHFVSRRFYATRWLDKNCNPQCYACNVGFAGQQYLHGQYIDSIYGVGTADSLMTLARGVNKITQEEIKTIIEQTKEKLYKLRN